MLTSGLITKKRGKKSLVYFRVCPILQLDLPAPRLGLKASPGLVYSMAKLCYFSPEVNFSPQLFFLHIFFYSGSEDSSGLCL